eukprot:CAMPEP_0185729834 /NCGR_PEP_ID=MMETSP1171-20130828/7480_1 /TAXON_ID=374046 /ORGANISM="Helicotheca tamensis, Strain CCMP826" /LENGTH=520 /DNA_ID=CAMNT_0028398761 /DNA_START=128 /DNA_END=1690 /DNA_ORIENTATION=+
MISEWKNRDLDKYYKVEKTLVGEGSMGAVSIVKKKQATAGGSAYNGSEHKKGIFKMFGSKRGDIVSDVDERYAMKSIRLGYVTDDFLDELRNEIIILRSLDHPNIVKAYEVYENKKNIYIIMELCTGGDLYQRNPYSEKDAARYTATLLSAISFLHSHDVVHRDLKFENIMFESTAPDAQIKVIDFGLSKKFMPNSDGKMTEGVGTIYTMAPQVLQGVYTSQADLWSIGVIAYMLLSRQKPFYHRKRRYVIDKIMRCDYNFNGPGWRHVSTEAMKFVSSLLVLDPKERLTADEALKHRWLDSNYKLSDRRPSEDVMQDVEGGLVDYGNTSDFKRMALMVVAHKSSTEEIAELRAAFDQYDSTNDGTITLDEFKLALSKSNYSEEEVEKMFAELDIDKNGKIYYTEFIAATLEVCGRIEEDRLAEAFDKIDDDDTGYITGKNLKNLLGKDYTLEKANKLLEEADLDKDGKISFDEFLRMFHKKNNSLRMDVLEGTHSDADESSLLNENAKIPGGKEEVSEE